MTEQAAVTPTIITVRYVGTIRNSPGNTRELVENVLLIPGTYKARPEDQWEGQVAAWNGHQFEVVTAKKYFQDRDQTLFLSFSIEDVDYENNPREFSMSIHYPIDKRTKPKDWEGAIGAYRNAENTGWLPKHTDRGTHHDRGLSFEDGVYVVFKPELDPLNAEIMGLDPRDAPHGRKVTEYKSLVQAQTKVIEKVVAIHEDRYLGYYEQHPHPEAGHIMVAVKDAFAAAKSENTALWRRASVALSRIEKAIIKRASQVVETRWDQEARIAAEKKAAAAQEV